MDQVVSGARASYYDVSNLFDVSSLACHLDLIPYATARKWTELTPQQRSALLRVAADTLALLLRDSPIRIVILNGRTVVEQFQEISGARLEIQEMPDWALPRQSAQDVIGLAYKGTVETLSGIGLGHDILILGFNHNLQSSYGVTTKAIHAIRDWVTRTVSEHGL